MYLRKQIGFTKGLMSLPYVIGTLPLDVSANNEQRGAPRQPLNL